MLEVDPRIGELAGPLARAVIVDHFLLRSGHGGISCRIDQPLEHNRAYRGIHVVLRHLVDAEQEHRAPGEGAGIGNTLGENVAKFRRAGLHIGAAEERHPAGDGALRRPDLHSPNVGRHHDFFIGRMPRHRIEHEGKAIMHILHLARRVFAVPGVDGAIAALRVADDERQLAGCDDREAPRLIAGIDVDDVGDAVARHVVVVERLTQLLCRKDFVGDGSVRGFLNIVAPVLDRLLQRMRRRHPVRDFQIDGLVLRARGADAKAQRGEHAGYQVTNAAHQCLPIAER